MRDLKIVDKLRTVNVMLRSSKRSSIVSHDDFVNVGRFYRSFIFLTISHEYALSVIVYSHVVSENYKNMVPVRCNDSSWSIASLIVSCE